MEKCLHILEYTIPPPTATRDTKEALKAGGCACRANADRAGRSHRAGWAGTHSYHRHILTIATLDFQQIPSLWLH